jgi:hypothetical protein
MMRVNSTSKEDAMKKQIFSLVVLAYLLPIATLANTGVMASDTQSTAQPQSVEYVMVNDDDGMHVMIMVLPEFMLNSSMKKIASNNWGVSVGVWCESKSIGTITWDSKTVTKNPEVIPPQFDQPTRTEYAWQPKGVQLTVSASCPGATPLVKKITYTLEKINGKVYLTKYSRI